MPPSAPAATRFGRALAAMVFIAAPMHIAAEDHPHMSEPLIQTVDSYFEHWLAGRIDAMAALFTEDSVYHPNGAAAVSGREALRAYYQAFVDSNAIELVWRYESAAHEGATGYVMGVYTIRYSPKAGGEPVERGGRFFMQLERGAGAKWRISRELTQSTDDPKPALTD